MDYEDYDWFSSCSPPNHSKEEKENFIFVVSAGLHFEPSLCSVAFLPVLLATGVGKKPLCHEPRRPAVTLRYYIQQRA
jgi:hypothetical protein